MKDISHALSQRIPSSVLSVMDQLRKAGYQAYAVGGCVRDAMLGRDPHDWDMTTNAKPDQMKQAVRFRFTDAGIKHGTVTFIVDHEPIEVTTFRIDGDYSDGRHPDSVSFATRLEDDLARRDFTVNAMAFSPETGVVDPFGGADDLKRGMLRCVGDASARFSEDGLRVMRALRFAATYGFFIEERTAAAIHEKKHMLDAVSKERISAELTKMMQAPDGAHLAAIVKEFADVLMQIMPELAPTYKLDQQNPHHDRDCFTHMVDVMAGVRPDVNLRLAGLLHDIGKPKAQKIGPDGIAHYKGHAIYGAEIVDDLLRRLKFPRKTVSEVVFLVRQHDNWPFPTKRSARRYLARCGDADTARKLLELMKSDRKAHAPASVDDRLGGLVDFGEIMEEALLEDIAFKVGDLEVSGRDLIARGWPPSRAIGEELDRLFDLVVTGELPNSRDALLAAIGDPPA